MRRPHVISLFVLTLLLLSCGQKEQKYSTLLTRHGSRSLSVAPTHAPLNKSDCVRFASLITASKLSRQLKRPKAWVAANYQIKLYGDTLAQANRVIGHVPPGADCYIIEEKGAWFFIQNPVNNELGWIQKTYIGGFILKDRQTHLPCGS